MEPTAPNPQPTTDPPAPEPASSSPNVMPAEVPPTQPAARLPDPPRKRWSIKVILIVLAAAALLGGGVLAWNYFQQSQQPKEDSSANTSPKKLTWIKPVKIADPGVFTNLEKFNSLPDSQATFYKVGTLGSTAVILVSIPVPLGPEVPALLLNDKPDHYLVLIKHSPALLDEKGKYSGPELSNQAEIDTTTEYADIAYQATIAIGKDKVKIVNTDKVDQLFSQYEASTNPEQKLVKSESNAYGNIYVHTLGRGDGFEIQEYVLSRPNATALSYQLKPGFVADDNVPKVTWNNKAVNKDGYRTDGIGSCGSANGLAILLSGSEDLAAAGTTDNGETVYEFSKTTNPTLNYFYKQYSIDPEGKKVKGAITLAQYKARHGVFAYKDALGRYVLFSSMKYGAQAECGKPVIYLYPISPTDVSVVVNALITKSEPLYQSGWQVRAYPDGRLVTGGRTYDSLFWEGTGKIYPPIVSGFVVPQADLAQTIPDHLYKLGLNDKEASDFLAFWTSRLPKTPYVRLTWFGTREMNALAPLAVKPQPDTMIRIFLDFEGLDRPINLPVQHLAAPSRRGFTLVEWGGLLRSSAKN